VLSRDHVRFCLERLTGPDHTDSPPQSHDESIIPKIHVIVVVRSSMAFWWPMRIKLIGRSLIACVVDRTQNRSQSGAYPSGET
jgi:hypothetical protein